MSVGTQLYRFRIQLSDVDRSVYDELDFRLAQHPSESRAFLLTRMFAYCLNLEPGLAFSAEGLCEPDDPCLSSDHPRGGKDLWIEVGNPSARRLHKAAKAAQRVKVYTYKNPEALLREIETGDVHRADQIEIFSFAPEFLASLEEILARDNQWNILRDQGALTVSVGEEVFLGELTPHPVGARR